MYVSDYGFAASPNAWTTRVFNYHEVISSNWMFMHLPELTISHYVESGFILQLYIDQKGDIGIDVGDISGPFVIRPTFSLLPSISYKSGTGTISDPLRIN